MTACTRPCTLGKTANGKKFVSNAAEDASLPRTWVIAGAGIIFKSLIDVRQELADGSLVALLTDWETEVYPLHALLASGRFIPNRVRALMKFLAGKFGGV